MMKRYVDPNSGAAPQPGGRTRAEVPPTPDTPRKLASEPEEEVSEDMSRDELLEAAKEEEVSGRHDMNKGELVEAVEQERAEPQGTQDVVEPNPAYQSNAAGDGDQSNGDDESEDGAEEEAEAEDPLMSRDREELLEIAKMKDIAGRHQMNKSELVEAIRAEK